MTQKKILFGPQVTHTFALLTRLFGQPEHHNLPAEQPNSAANFRLLMFTLNQNALIRRRHLGIQVQKPQLLLLRKEERQVLNIFALPWHKWLNRRLQATQEEIPFAITLITPGQIYWFGAPESMQYYDTTKLLPHISSRSRSPVTMTHTHTEMYSAHSAYSENVIYKNDRHFYFASVPYIPYIYIYVYILLGIFLFFCYLAGTENNVKNGNVCAASRSTAPKSVSL